MRKFAIPSLVLALVLAISAVAYAVTNVYQVNGSISPSKVGTAKKPKPIAVNFGYRVGEREGLRPSPVKQYKILIGGLRVNTNHWPSCTAQQINKAQSDRRCPKGSKVGGGFIKNATGASNDPSDRSIQCNASVSVYNVKNNRASLFIKGSPNSTDPRTKCAIELAEAIPANYVRTSRGTELRFRVPSALLHPLPGLDNAVESVTSKIPRQTRKVKGRTIGYYESVGGCRKGKRPITVTFVAEDGSVAKAQKLLNCS